MSVEADETELMTETRNTADPADFAPFSQRALSGKVALITDEGGQAEAHV